MEATKERIYISSWNLGQASIFWDKILSHREDRRMFRLDDLFLIVT